MIIGIVGGAALDRFNRRTITLKHGRIISDVPASFGEEVHV